MAPGHVTRMLDLPILSPPASRPARTSRLPCSTIGRMSEAHDSEECEFVLYGFSLLPTELRLKIWAIFRTITTPPVPTIVIATYGSQGSRTGGQRWVADDSILRKGHPIPAILHVNQEARGVGFEKYVLGFEVQQDLQELPFNHCWRRVE